ncbi:EthD family reductase [Celeribacter naphthalenivorans]|uniref:EthD family reductase n=1 Tax=Celeribacter naphthalenivorans TaxID=1614694 RepID=UPI001CFAE5F5|nr:EthD family reductase [Celeribacter naphthalenivorans]
MTVKRMTLLERRGDLSFADFDSHWAGPHGRLAKGFPGLARYHQNPVQSCVGPDRHGIAGIVELWFEDVAAMTEALASPVADALIEDEPNFLSGITILAVEEEVVTPTPMPPNLMIVIDEGTMSPDGLASWGRDIAAMSGVEGLTLNHVTAVSKRQGLGALATRPLAVVSLVAAPATCEALAQRLTGTLYVTAQRRIV